MSDILTGRQKIFLSKRNGSNLLVSDILIQWILGKKFGSFTISLYLCTILILTNKTKK